MPNIFNEPKELKKWAIKLANACGGQRVEKTLVMTKVNPQRTIKIAKQMEEE